MTSSEPEDLRIRNQRYWPWIGIAGGMLLVLFLAVVFLPFALDRRFDRVAKWSRLAVMFAIAVHCLRFWLLAVDLKERPRPSRRDAARAGWDWVVRGVRPRDSGRIRVTLALALFGWLAPTRISVASLRLGDAVRWLDDPRLPVPVPAGEVRCVRFAPDPAEDYAERDRPVHFCAAAVEFHGGKEFRLILDEADAGRLREWAAGKDIAVIDSDGYEPRTAGPVGEGAVRE